MANAASKYKDVSLNSCLETGLALMNNMFGHLLQLREKSGAVSADTEDMFLQLKIKINMRLASSGLLKMVSNNTNSRDLSLVRNAHHPLPSLGFIKQLSITALLNPILLNCFKKAFTWMTLFTPLTRQARLEYTQLKSSLRQG